jgi:hypothetical protein
MSATTETAHDAGRCAAQPRKDGGGSGGLVPSKTKCSEVFIGFDHDAGHARRIARMRRSVWGASSFLTRPGYRAWFVTLTYRQASDWRGDHVRAYMRRVREWCRDLGVTMRYVWVAELQQRGAMHYHVAVWLPKRLALPKPDKSGWWPHGFSNRQLAVSPIGYLMKYVSKGDTVRAHACFDNDTAIHFPKGARIYGIGGLCGDGKAVRQWLNMPEWAKAGYGVGEVTRVKHRVVVRDSGEILASPYDIERTRRGMRLRLVRPLAERFHAGPYSRLRAAA